MALPVFTASSSPFALLLYIVWKKGFKKGKKRKERK
jgi:hypothetical protein